MLTTDALLDSLLGFLMGMQARGVTLCLMQMRADTREGRAGPLALTCSSPAPPSSPPIPPASARGSALRPCLSCRHERQTGLLLISLGATVLHLNDRLPHPLVCNLPSTPPGFAASLASSPGDGPLPCCLTSSGARGGDHCRRCLGAGASYTCTGGWTRRVLSKVLGSDPEALRVLMLHSC
jgi:hypothetical protein